MRITEILDSVKKSEVFALTYEGKVLGLRVKYFDVNTLDFCFYDFRLRLVSGDTVLRDFIESHQKEFTKVALIEKDGILASQAELDGRITANEFESENDAIATLRRVKDVYDYKKGGVANV